MDKVQNLKKEGEKGNANSSGNSCEFEITWKKEISRKIDLFHTTTYRYDELRQTSEQGMEKIIIPEAK